MTTKMTLIPFVCFLAASCSLIGPEPVQAPELFHCELSASINNQPDTRTSLSTGYKTLWDEAGEAISLVDKDGGCYEMVQKSVSQDRKSAVFSGEIPVNGCSFAVYPVQAEVPIDNGLLGVSIPTEQEAVPGTFDTATNLAIAKVDGSNSLIFKNVCGLVGISTTASGITSIRLSGTETGGGAFSGSAMVTFEGDVPVCVSSKDTGVEYVELEGEIQPNTRYVAMVYPGTYDNLELTFTDDQGRTATLSRSGSVTIKRSGVLDIKPVNISESDWKGADPDDEPGGTATLTYEECSGVIAGYSSTVNYANDYGTWEIRAYKESGMQLNSASKTSWIGTPEFPGVIKSITVENGHSVAATLYACLSPGSTDSVPSPNVSVAVNGSGSYTLDVSTLEAKKLYIRSNKVVRLTSVTVVWGGSGTAPEPDPGPGPDPDIPIPEPSGLADYGWFELPGQVDKDSNGIDDNNPDYYYSHTFRADAAKIRNFSCCYSKGNMQPVWVAAPMHNCYKGSSGRNESYKADPNIKCAQAGKVDGYTKGHMLGSSDRTVSKETNRQVFYYSNIGAQLQSGFNTGGGSWNNLESLTDGQWCADTLYQVIGCIFKTFTDRYGNTVEPKTVGSVHIPTAYYKALLRTKNGKTGKRVDQCTADELKCAAFILCHRSFAGHKPSANDMYTVEELEAITGLTFFVNVPNAPKSTAKASDWGL